MLRRAVFLLPCLLSNFVTASIAGNHYHSEDTKAVLSAEPVESINLNTDRNYAEYKENQPWAAVTELIQNLFDQAIVSCNYSAPTVSYTYEEDCDEEAWQFQCSDEPKVQVASLIVRWQRDDTKQRSGIEKMTLINCDSELTVDAFVHGYSTKRETSELAGHFGDGLKKAVAKILAQSAEVLFYSGKYLMRPEYKYRSLFAKELLHLSLYALPSPTSAVTIEVFNLPATAFDVTRYLYLQLDKPTLYRAPGIGSVLPFTNNRVFLKGLLVQSETQDLQNTALNVELPTKYMIDNHDLGKERDSIGNRPKLVLHVLFSMMDYHNYSNYELNKYVADKLVKVVPATADRGIMIEDERLLIYAYSFLSSYQPGSHLRVSSLVPCMLPPSLKNMTIVVSTKDRYDNDHKELALVTDFRDVHHVGMSDFVHQYFRHRFMDIVAYKKNLREKIENQGTLDNNKSQELLVRIRASVQDYFPCIAKVAYKSDSSGPLLLDDVLMIPESYVTPLQKQDDASTHNNNSKRDNIPDDFLANLRQLVMKMNPDCAIHKERQLTQTTLDKDFKQELRTPRVQQLVPVFSPQISRVIARDPYSKPTFHGPPNTLPGERSFGFNLTKTSTPEGRIVYVEYELLQSTGHNDTLPLFMDDDVSEFLHVIDEAKVIIGANLLKNVSINLFYQNSEVIGFNAHHIFLNLAAFKHGDRSAVWRWATTIMHELTHDSERSHDVDFVRRFGDWVSIALKNMLAMARKDDDANCPL